MHSDQMNTIFKNKEETKANDKDIKSMHIIQFFLSQLKEEDLELFSDIFEKLGLGQRKKYQIIDDSFDKIEVGQAEIKAGQANTEAEIKAQTSQDESQIEAGHAEIKEPLEPIMAKLEEK